MGVEGASFGCWKEGVNFESCESERVVETSVFKFIFATTMSREINFWLNKQIIFVPRMF